MIENYTLKKLVESYGLNYENMIEKNDNILEYGEFRQIDKVLYYLIKVMKIQPKNIEKAPSVLYRNVEVIKENYDLLKNSQITISNYNSCLHILSTEPNTLKQTYD
jgi:hypothetical protein